MYYFNIFQYKKIFLKITTTTLHFNRKQEKLAKPTTTPRPNSFPSQNRKGFP